MTENEIIETAIQGHASTRDAIRRAIQQEREACARLCENIINSSYGNTERQNGAILVYNAIRARGEK
jgi:hypothetical protein